MKNRKNISLILAIFFSLITLVFIILFIIKNITEFNPNFSDFSNLRYVNFFMNMGMISFALSVLNLIVYIIDLKSKLCINSKVLNTIFVLSLSLFVGLVIYNVYPMFSDYHEDYYFSDEAEPDKNVEKYFPMYEVIDDQSISIPIWSFNEYKIKNEKYISTQVTDRTFDDSNVIELNIDFFESENQYIMGKYQGEKSFLYTIDNYSEELPKDSLKHSKLDGYDYDFITLNNERRIIINKDNCYFAVQAINIDISDEALLSMALQQFSYMKE